MKRNHRISFSRNELVALIDGLEALEEEFTYHGGLDLIQDELALLERLRERLNPRHARLAVEKQTAA